MARMDYEDKNSYHQNWNMTEHLNDLDFADGIALWSRDSRCLQTDGWKEGGREGMNGNLKKKKLHPSSDSIMYKICY